MTPRSKRQPRNAKPTRAIYLFAYGPTPFAMERPPLEPCGDMLPVRGPSYFFLLTKLPKIDNGCRGSNRSLYPRF